MWILQFQAEAVRALQPDPIRHARIDETLSQLTDVQGACERLKATPVPRQYEYFPRLFLYVYATLLPLSLGAHLEWFTPLVSVPVSFLFLALERVGGILETPFENLIFDVPLSAMCRTLERNLRELAGDPEPLPPPLEPVNGYLW
jgi:ion channel-forming bestrophin family protein